MSKKNQRPKPAKRALSDAYNSAIKKDAANKTLVTSDINQIKLLCKKHGISTRSKYARISKSLNIISAITFMTIYGQNEFNNTLNKRRLKIA